jgi:hypothetical protein
MDYVEYFRRMPLTALKQVKRNAEDAIARPGSRFHERCLEAHPVICSEIKRRSVRGR